MARSAMKEQLHQRLWGAQARWFRLREAGMTKHDLKIRGLREQGEVSAKTGKLLFTGNTRVTYERELKRFVGFCHDELGRRTNDEIGAKDFAAYMETCLGQGSTAGHLNKLKSAISKFGAVFGKTRSFRAMSKRWGKRIRALRKEGSLASPARPRVTPEVRERVGEILLLRDLKSEKQTGLPRGYHLALRLQEEASLRAIEATKRFTPECLVGMRDGNGLARIPVG